MKRYTEIDERRVVGHIDDVTLEHSDDGSSVTVMGRIKPCGRHGEVLRDVLFADTVKFGMRVITVQDSNQRVTTAQVVTWDLIDPMSGDLATVPEVEPTYKPTNASEPKTCGNCAYIGDEHVIDLDDDADSSKWQFDVPTGFYKCTYAQHHERPRHCVPEGVLAFVEDGSDYHAALKVKTDFGCVAHKPKLIPVTQD